MKVQEKKQAIALRKAGTSMGDIAEQIGVAKSSVSYWVRDVRLTKDQRNKLNQNGHSVDAIEKRRISRMSKTDLRRTEIIEQAKTEAVQLYNNPLWCIGVSLYWGEGGKTQNMVRISNSDPAVITLMLRFFTEVCNAPIEKMRGHVHTFSHQHVGKTEQYWSELSGIPLSQFFKTYVKQSSASKKKRDTLPYGTFQLYVHDTDLFFRIKGWMEAVKEKYS